MMSTVLITWDLNLLLLTFKLLFKVSCNRFFCFLFFLFVFGFFCFTFFLFRVIVNLFLQKSVCCAHDLAVDILRRSVSSVVSFIYC